MILDLTDSPLSQLPELHRVEQQDDLWTNLFTTNVKGVEERAFPSKSSKISAFASHKTLNRQQLAFDVPFAYLELK